MILYVNPEDAPEESPLEQSEFSIFRNENDIVVERTYDYYQTIADTLGDEKNPEEGITFNAKTLEKVDPYTYDEDGKVVKDEFNNYVLKDGYQFLDYTVTSYLDESIKYYDNNEDLVEPVFEDNITYVTATYQRQCEATDTVIIKDVVTKYDAESLKFVVGYSTTTTYM